MTSDKIEMFGKTPDGTAVQRVRISGGGLTANVITWGAVIQDLRLEGYQPPLVLGFETLDDYLQHSPYFGATPGRCANRIADGRFSIDGKPYQLELNERGVTHLHGGSDGLGRRIWTITDLTADSVTLQTIDPDGRAGYPGNVTVTASYRLLPGGVLSVVYESTTDAATPVNVCQHSYFNLDGLPDALGHDMMLAADAYLPIDERLIPTGEIRPVADTAFDFRAMTSMKRFEDGVQLAYDHNFCLSGARTAKRTVGLVRSIHSGVALELRTTEPGVQLYTGGKLAVAVPGLEGRRYGAFAGFCLETQVWPDAVNQPAFPNAVLRPGEVLRQETDYVFSRS